jgi:Bacterial Ig domain
VRRCGGDRCHRGPAGPATAAAQQAPVALADRATTAEGTAVVVDVLSNDTDPDGDALMLSAVAAQPGHGTAEVTGTEVTYRPAAGFVGDDVFPYTVSDSTGRSASAQVTVTVTATPNSPPVAVADNATVETGQTVSVPVLANDSDADGDSLALASVSAAAHGAATVAGQNVSYSSSVGFVGDDSFAYTVSDSQGATATATVTLTVTAPPVSYANNLNVAATVVARRTSAITGSVGPVPPGPPTVVLQRSTGGGWVPVRTAVAGADGTYAFSYIPNAAGAIVWQTVATWPDGATATSAAHTMTVLARLDATVSGPLTRRDVPYSYRPGCPVGPQALRRVTMTYYDYQGRLQRGQLIVSARSVTPLLRVFASGFNARFPLKRLHPSDFYYANGKRSPSASDVAAMRDGNTSAFNCRSVTGNP